ncbi:kinetochore scaffold 1 [Melopsittacus undulatus]|uniref:kinetochore scaffold 1 n=1 Tax=Melopsittacus undulatus TaxID=13146 RepID=UPI00146D77C9|nr:kinetochore scaffold 1 [Melopsittacus undulatus]
MEKVYADPNLEIDNTESIRGKRLSSILKAPRYPLDDLGNGNELTQDINTEKRRRNSRRVSFANTINCRVFQTDLKNNTAEGQNTECAEETENDALNENEEPEAVPCEITGMSTLLHAPIQALVQQTECYDADNAIQRQNRHNTTFIFTEENEMDMTASHTAVITRNLKNNQADNTEKIDIKSFLAGLNSSSGKAEGSKEVQFFSDPTSHLCPLPEQKEDAATVKKIDFNEFLMSLKSNEKTPSPVEGPEKENVFFLPSQAPEAVAPSSVEFAHSHKPLDTCNVTKVFREEDDDGMEVTKCQGSLVKATFSSQAPPQQVQCEDVTKAFVDDGMDMTTSHTAKVSFPSSSVGNQSLNFQKDFPCTELDNSTLKRPSHQHFIVQQDTQLCTGRKPLQDRLDPTVLRAAKQEARAGGTIPGTVSSETVFRGDKTVDVSKCEDMEITGNYTDIFCSDSTKGMNRSHLGAFEKPVNSNTVLAEHSRVAHDGRDTAKSLTALGHGAPVLYKTRALEVSSGSDELIKKVSQDHGNASVNAGFDSCTNPASCGKTVIFSGEDMDLTKTCVVKDGGNAVLTCVPCKPHFPGNRSTCPSSNDEEEMEITRCHAVVIDGHSKKITAEANQMHGKMIPGKNQNTNISEGANYSDVDKENREVMSSNGNVERSQPLDTMDLEMVEKQLGKPDFQASGASSCAKTVCPLQQQKREVPENSITQSCAFVSLQSQKVLAQPLGKSLRNASVSSTSDRTGTFSGEQNSNMTKTHPPAPVNAVQEHGNSHNHSKVLSQPLQNQTSQCSTSSGAGVMSQTAAAERVALKMSTSNQTVAPLAPHGSFIPSNEPAPSGMKGNEQHGTALGLNASDQSSGKQGRDSRRSFAVGKRVSSEEAFKSPHGTGGLCLRGAEEQVEAIASEPHMGHAQVPSFFEKSVVFPSGENMDLTGNITAALSARKPGPGFSVQDENKPISLSKGVTMTVNPQEQPVCDTHSLVGGKTTLTMGGLKHLSLPDETIFPEDADMDITRSHTVSADNKITVQLESSNGGTSLMAGEKTCVFTYNNDMEISRLATAAIDKPMEKAGSLAMFNPAKKTGRKSLKGTAEEKTVLFSLNDDNNDMEITESHTAAIGHEMVLQNEAGLQSLPSAHPIKTAVFTSSQVDMDTIRSCSADKTVACDDKPKWDKVVGDQVLSDGEATVFALDDMDVTRTHHVALEEDPLPGRQLHGAGPVTPTAMFTSSQAEMEITESHPVDLNVGRGFCEAQELRQEVGVGSKTVIFSLAEDMEFTKAQTAVMHGEMVLCRESIPARAAAPADKTIVFTRNQDEMEITASHTVAVNNNISGLEQEASQKSAQQADLHCGLSSCRGETDSSHPGELNGECHPKPKDEPSISSSAPSASVFPNNKGAIPVPSGTAPNPLCSVSPPEETMDVGAPQDVDLPMDNSVPVSREQDLIPPETLSSKGGSSRLPSKSPMDCGVGSGDLASHGSLPNPAVRGSPDAKGNQGLEEDSCRGKDLATGLGLAGADLVTVSNKESKENQGLSAEGETPPKDFDINSDQTKPLVVNDGPRDRAVPTHPSDFSGILNICSKLRNIRRKSAVFPVSVQLPNSSAQPEDALRAGKNTLNEPSNTKEQEDTCLESAAAPTGAPLGKALKDPYQGINVPLGIFQPKLPNRRKPSVSSSQGTKSSDKREALVAEVTTGETPCHKKPVWQNFSPSQFIAEEFLPVCLEEMDSNGSVSSELVENNCNEISKAPVSHEEKNQETKPCNTKRALKQDQEHPQSPKKTKRDEDLLDETSQHLQVTLGAMSQSQEVPEGEDPPNLSAKSPNCTHASTSSSLDSVKADMELKIQQSSHMESQLLNDSICEDNLREKFQSGVITVGEFFTLLQVHVPIQKPRRSQIPASVAVSAAPTPQDLMYSQYVHRPKLRIYEEDCQALSQLIEELKPCANIRDQLLVNVNKSLWEVMRTCSDEELKSFGAEMNKMKSYFTKESKILGHNQKVTLYSRLLQSAQEQRGKLQSRVEQVDGLLKEAESCLVALGGDSDWDEGEAGCDGSDETAEWKNLQEELENLKAQEEQLQRELSELETENEQMVAEMTQLKKKEESCKEILERYDFTEWQITEWSEQHAIFSFLYDAIELIVVFGTPTDGDVFSEDPSRKIVSLNFESFLDEEEAPRPSCLVQRLIFQFIQSRGCWQEKCPTLSHLPQALHDISLVVNRCKILGEELEYLERWGGKFNLLKTEISDTKVKLLFSASKAFAKFGLTLSLSATYPSAPLPFTVQHHIGNIGEEEISAVVSKVPVGYHYLRRIVSSIHQSLLQDPR